MSPNPVWRSAAIVGTHIRIPRKAPSRSPSTIPRFGECGPRRDEIAYFTVNLDDVAETSGKNSRISPIAAGADAETDVQSRVCAPRLATAPQIRTAKRVKN